MPASQVESDLTAPLTSLLSPFIIGLMLNMKVMKPRKNELEKFYNLVRKIFFFSGYTNTSLLQDKLDVFVVKPLFTAFCKLKSSQMVQNKQTFCTFLCLCLCL